MNELTFKPKTQHSVSSLINRFYAIFLQPLKQNNFHPLREELFELEYRNLLTYESLPNTA